MKKITLSLLCTLYACHLFAAVTTVSNNANSPGQYTNLQTAIDNASNGDTIYVHGSPFNYGNIYLNRSLTLIGTGYNPKKDVPLVAQINYLYLDSVAGIKGCSNSTITGFYITTNLVHGPSAYAFHNISIKLNRINQLQLSPASASNIVIWHNALHYIYSLQNITNLVLRNNIIYSSIANFSANNAVLVTNNLFFSNGNTGLTMQDFSTITNNIFVGSHPNSNGATYNNNLIFNTTSDVLPYGSNTGSGNLNGVNPQFVNVPSYNNINFDYDYHLLNASAGHNAGTDGTDLGPFGGNDPLPDLTGTPPVPQVKVFNISNSIINPSTPLNIYVKAKKQ